nr:hypothetical protein [Pandoravirus massiliensis]
MSSAYAGGAWGGPSTAGGAKMAAIHQCLDALRPPSPPPQRHTAPVVPMPPIMGALDALPSPLEPFCPPTPDGAPRAVAVQTHTDAPLTIAGGETHPIARPATTTTTAVAATIPAGASDRVVPPAPSKSAASASARAAAALRSPAVLAIGAALVVVLVLVVVAPPFVLKKRGSLGASGDPAWRWARPRAQVDPIRLLAWGLLTAAAAFVLPLAVERLVAAPSGDTPPEASGLFCRKPPRA